MTYVSAITDNEEVVVWERNNPDQRDSYRDKADFYCYVPNETGTYTSLDGTPLSKHTFNNRRELQQFTKLHSKVFESDIQPELKYLSKRYYEAKAPTLNVTFLDIEVDYDETIGFSSVDNPYAPINAIALYHKHSNESVLYVVPPKPEDYLGDPSHLIEGNLERLMNDVVPLPTDTRNIIKFCTNEKELLLCILEEIDNSDVISGWNSDWFDVPYIGRRIMHVLDKIDTNRFCQTKQEKFPDIDELVREINAVKKCGGLRRLSFNEGRKPRWRTAERYGVNQWLLDLSGRVSLDYLELFRKYEMAERPSYKLEAISEEVLPDLPKLEYEGSLASLYKKDLPWFCRYNFRDTEILKGFEEKLGYVELANQMVHLSTGLFEHVTGTLKLADLATINFCHNDLEPPVIVPDVDRTVEVGNIKGAVVLIPQVGMHDGIGSVDINSLYPSAIRAINISPETIIGQFEEKITASEEIAKNSKTLLTFVTEDNEVITQSARVFKSMFSGEKYAVSGFGTVFDQNKKGVIPAILENWYATRKNYQRLMIEAKNNDDKDMAAYYNRLQYVFKIKLNSFYGALTNQYFRFYDLRMGESTTATGRAILIHQGAECVNVIQGEYTIPNRICIKNKKKEYIPATQFHIDRYIANGHSGRDPNKDDNENSDYLIHALHYGYTNEYPIIYGDTDSIYFSTGFTDKEKSIEFADMVGEEINKSFPEFMRKTFLCNDGYDQLIRTGREIVSDRGIFVDKKRYILHIVNDDGFDTDKIKVMGLDTKKTTLPKEVAKKLNGFIERHLKGEDWSTIATDIVQYKDDIMNINDKNFMSIGLPRGIKKVEIYTNKYASNSATFLPGHVSAALYFNKQIEHHKDLETNPIRSGDKIKVFYMIKPDGRFKAIAIPVDIEQVPSWFIDKYVPLINHAAHITRLVDKPLTNIIKAIGKESPSHQSLYVDNLLIF